MIVYKLESRNKRECPVWVEAPKSLSVIFVKGITAFVVPFHVPGIFLYDIDTLGTSGLPWFSSPVFEHLSQSLHLKARPA